MNYDQLIKFHNLNNIPIPDIELNKRRLMRNIENFMLDEAKYVFPQLNLPNGSVGVFWNHPNYKENINIKTKRLGKKQITWFKKEDRLKMINSENPDDVYKDIMEIINE